MKQRLLKFIILTIFSFSSYKSYAAPDKFVQCESCSSTQMKFKANSVASSIGNQDVYVFSISTGKIRSYDIEVMFDSESGHSYLEVYSYEKTINSTVKKEFKELSIVLQRVQQAEQVQYTGVGCETSECLMNAEGLGFVTSWLNKGFIVPAHLHNQTIKIFGGVLKALFNSKNENYSVAVCFNDGVCVEFDFVILLTSYAWKPTGLTGTSISNNQKNSGLRGILTCTSFVEYRGTTADGIYCEEWQYTKIHN